MIAKFISIIEILKNKYPRLYKAIALILGCII
jgi:hypothetical protein